MLDTFEAEEGLMSIGLPKAQAQAIIKAIFESKNKLQKNWQKHVEHNNDNLAREDDVLSV